MKGGWVEEIGDVESSGCKHRNGGRQPGKLATIMMLEIIMLLPVCRIATPRQDTHTHPHTHRGKDI